MGEWKSVLWVFSDEIFFCFFFAGDRLGGERNHMDGIETGKYFRMRSVCHAM